MTSAPCFASETYYHSLISNCSYLFIKLVLQFQNSGFQAVYHSYIDSVQRCCCLWRRPKWTRGRRISSTIRPFSHWTNAGASSSATSARSTTPLAAARSPSPLCLMGATGHAPGRCTSSEHEHTTRCKRENVLMTVCRTSRGLELTNLRGLMIARCSIDDQTILARWIMTWLHVLQ